MKQTNNAIKFLMAQYRAIFKNAYFKGLTSALVLTAGLAAAGTVQAASDFPINSGNMAYEYTISSDGTTWVGASDSGSSANDSLSAMVVLYPPILLIKVQRTSISVSLLSLTMAVKLS